MQRLLPRRKKRRAEIPHPSSSEAPIPNRTNPKIYKSKKKKMTRTDRSGEGDDTKIRETYQDRTTTPYAVY